jgi:hypothetical protein
MPFACQKPSIIILGWSFREIENISHQLWAK